MHIRLADGASSRLPASRTSSAPRPGVLAKHVELLRALEGEWAFRVPDGRWQRRAGAAAERREAPDSTAAPVPDGLIRLRFRRRVHH